MKCQYGGCNEEVFEQSGFCILHIDLPEDEKSERFIRINDLKNAAIENKKIKEDFNFKGVKLNSVDFSNLKIDKDLIFAHAIIKKDFYCNNTEIKGDIWSDNVNIGEHTFFEQSNIIGSVSFFRAEIGGNISFDKAKIGKYAWFEGLKTEGEASFNHVEINGSLSFKEAKIIENVSFYASHIEGHAWFDNAYIGGNTWFDFTEIKGGLSFKNTNFRSLKGQEKAFRNAKIIWERLGDRENADYHFYHEMEAKRKQKPFYVKYPELIVQYPFGYGAYPFRLLTSFLIILLVFALIYWIIDGNSLNSLLEKIRFSFLVLIIPAYGVISAKSDIYGLFTIFEAFIGAFTWPTFIVTFARKYMR
ncbi:potassium channel family protein [Methanobacterium oryzae]|uniref:potassium channel family protein n=1 Tax=Methanobacterium oryzae TaxID=69540 RepID=UPI003D1B1DDC